MKQVTDSTQGFSLGLAGLKALLEHDIELNLVADRYATGKDKLPREAGDAEPAAGS